MSANILQTAISRSPSLLLKLFVISLCLVGASCRSKDNASKPLGMIERAGAGKVKIVENGALVRQLVDPKSSRKAALIFYYADTAEPYMQGAVAHEIRSLQEACSFGDQAVNWVAFFNSLYSKKIYLKCFEGRYSIQPLAVPFLDEKIAALTSIDFDPSLKNDTDPRTKLFDKALALKHPPTLNNEYVSQPFVHPEVFKSILAYAMSEVYPAKDYSYFLTVKGHGGPNFTLTGLTAEQLDKKVKNQNAVLERLKMKLVNFTQPGGVGIKVSKELDAQLNRLWLGQVRPRSAAQQNRPQRSVKQPSKGLNADITGLNADIPGLNADIPGLNADIPGLNVDIPGLNADIPGLNADVEGLNADITGLNADIPGLNADIPGLNADIQGLGVNAPGLSADNHFGMTPEIYFGAIGQAIVTATNNNPALAEIAYLNIESCESQIRGGISGGPVKLVSMLELLHQTFRAGYSAEGSLWYRSYDWNNILFDWMATGATAANLQNMLISLSYKVANFSYE